jgi:hypothetical protein
MKGAVGGANDDVTHRATRMSNGRFDQRWFTSAPRLADKLICSWAAGRFTVEITWENVLRLVNEHDEGGYPGYRGWCGVSALRFVALPFGNTFLAQWFLYLAIPI